MNNTRFEYRANRTEMPAIDEKSDHRSNKPSFHAYSWKERLRERSTFVCFRNLPHY